jgi:hypothetical protein
MGLLTCCCGSTAFSATRAPPRTPPVATLPPRRPPSLTTNPITPTLPPELPCGVDSAKRRSPVSNLRPMPAKPGRHRSTPGTEPLAPVGPHKVTRAFPLPHPPPPATPDKPPTNPFGMSDGVADLPLSRSAGHENDKPKKSNMDGRSREAGRRGGENGVCMPGLPRPPPRTSTCVYERAFLRLPTHFGMLRKPEILLLWQATGLNGNLLLWQATTGLNGSGPKVGQGMVGWNRGGCWFRLATSRSRLTLPEENYWKIWGLRSRRLILLALRTAGPHLA